MGNLTTQAMALIKRHEQLIRFLIAGGWNTVFGLSAFAGLYLLLEDTVHYLVVAVAANILAITNAFFVYRYLVFFSTGSLWKEYIKMYAVYAVSFAINLVVLAILVEVIDLHPIAAQFAIVLVTVIVSYFGHSRFTFAGSSDSRDSESPDVDSPDFAEKQNRL